MNIEEVSSFQNVAESFHALEQKWFNAFWQKISSCRGEYCNDSRNLQKQYDDFSLSHSSGSYTSWVVKGPENENSRFRSQIIWK